LQPPGRPSNVDGVTPNALPVRRLLVRLSLLFAVAQLIAAGGVAFLLPSLGVSRIGLVLLVLLAVVDIALLSIFAIWVLRAAIWGFTEQLAADVHRIADGDYHHRVGDPRRAELRPIQESVNRLADRLIADRRLLAENVSSLEETNRELVSLRDQMVHSARLASVGTLAAGIAHEVGNPLGAIMAFVDVAKARVAKAGGDTEILESIRHEADRIDRIVRGLLDYARAPDAREEPAPAADVLLGVRELLESQGKLDGVDVAWEVAAGAPDLVAEPHRLQQVLVNLLLNALDALEGAPSPRIRVGLRSEEGGLTRLRARREEDPPGVNYMHRRRLGDDEVGIDPVSRASRVTVIEVSDNGPGIPEKDLARIFDPFFTTKEPGKGTGLGLSICARLVEGMGGQIEASRESGGGARFVIRLPGISAPDATTVVSEPNVEAT